MWFLALLMAAVHVVHGTVVREVPLGGTAVLPCPSSDDAVHRFMYWEVGNDQVIGPGNPFNTNKYHYEVWSGRLFIKGVAAEEAGLYKCISKHVANPGLKIEGVQLVVQRDWEDSYEEDPAANAYRAVIAILILLILALLGVFTYCMRSRRGRNLSQLGNMGNMPREESPDEGPSTRPQRAYNPTTTDKPYSSRDRPQGRALDNAIVETDIKTSFSLADYP